MAALTDERKRAITAPLRRAAPALAWACLIFAGSSVPGTGIPGGFSVQGHLVEYAVFGALVLHALIPHGPTRRAAYVALAVCAVYAVTDEVHQSFVPGRMPDPADWALDAIGSSIGIAAGLLIARWRASRQAG